MNTRGWIGILVLAAANLFFIGCGKNQYDAEIQELDSLKSQIVAAHAEFKTIDSTKLLSINKLVFEDLRFIQRNYKPDTLDMETAMLINAYKDVRKACAKYFMVRHRLVKNFPYSEKQVSNLVYDLKEQTLSKDEADKYIQTEKLASKSMLDAWLLYKTGVPWVTTKYDSLRPIIDSFKQALQAAPVVP